MTQKLSVGQQAVGFPGAEGDTPSLFIDALATVISQYASSPVLTTIVRNMADAINVQTLLDDFYHFVWNVDSARNWGLDVWGRIVGVSRVLHVPIGGFFGFKEATDGETFNNGIWYGKGVLTTNYSLSDNAYRRLILAKAALNITDGSIPSINGILMALFPDHGNCYVRDDGGMAMTFVFGADLTPSELAIVGQAGVLPKPIGVSVAGEIDA